MPTKTQKKILIVQLRQLGDILVTTPVIRALHDHNFVVDVMTYPMGTPIISGNPLVDQHLIAPQKNTIQSVNFLFSLWSRHYDAIIDFMATPRSATMARIVRSPRRISFASRRAWLFDEVVPRFPKPEYIVNEKFRLLEPLGVQGHDVRLMLPWTPKDAELAVNFYRRSRPQSAGGHDSNSPWRVILSATSRRTERQWPKASWLELATFLRQTYQAEITWSWAPGEEQVVDEILESAPDIGVKSPRTSFRELAALVANSDLVIANSNGAAHVAIATNTPSIQLHGPSDAVSWCPLTDRHRAIQKRSMDQIAVDDVVSVIFAMRGLIDQGVQQLRARSSLTHSDDVWNLRPSLD